MSARPGLVKWWRFCAVAGVTLVPTAARASDVDFYGVFKSQAFNQTSTAAPVPKGSPYRFDALVSAAASNLVTSATVQIAPGGPVQLVAVQADLLQVEYKAKTLGALDGVSPNGNYHLVINAVHDGTHTITLPLNGDAYPSSDPHVSNFAVAQRIDPAAAFTLMWDQLNGGTTNDYIQVAVQDTVGQILFRTPWPGQPGSLNGTATSVPIPANTLPPGTPLFGYVLFARAVALDSTSYPGVLGVAGYFTQTDFTLATTNSPAAPRLDVVSASGAGQFQLQLTGQAGELYVIEASTGLGTMPWVPLVTNPAVGGRFVFTDAQSSTFSARFYRGSTGN